MKNDYFSPGKKKPLNIKHNCKNKTTLNLKTGIAKVYVIVIYLVI